MELTQTADFESADDIALADKMNRGRQQIIDELKKRIIGQSEVIELVLLTLFVGGNTLIVGVPGLAKTLLMRRGRGPDRSSTASSSRRT